MAQDSTPLTIGDFEPPEQLDVHVGLTFYPASFAVPWEQSGKTADFFSEYFSGVTSCMVDAAGRPPVCDAIGYVLNELVENALKFGGEGTVGVTVGVAGDEVVLRVDNTIPRGSVEPLCQALSEYVSEDPEMLLIQRVEQNAEDPEAGTSGLGFITMMTDYGAKLGWRVVPERGAARVCRLWSMARVPIRE